MWERWLIFLQTKVNTPFLTFNLRYWTCHIIIFLNPSHLICKKGGNYCQNTRIFYHHSPWTIYPKVVDANGSRCKTNTIKINGSKITITKSRCRARVVDCLGVEGSTCRTWLWPGGFRRSSPSPDLPIIKNRFHYHCSSSPCYQLLLVVEF